MYGQLHEELLAVLRQDPAMERLIAETELAVDSNETTPKIAVRHIIASFLAQNAFARSARGGSL